MMMMMMRNDEDDEELLLQELAKIKEERKLKKQKEEEKLNIENAKISNPLVQIQDDDDEISGSGSGSGKQLKKSWRDQSVFRKQSVKSDDGNGKDRYVNDMLKSDFHKKFMNKYIR
ncbi:hypothetical protein CANARDRAFT_109436 [[Candida] arabinofermentans NRRL YB-2248]|uniref:Pre-mRNA-splicing factor CWC15 n=1 Tax=[Candida] arabinofermentans NRRL YB-2248 TaxID=983967 RepID=A0A1E4STM4_9ASCO|nr:hypothetical protein CANARDRAFT_109436 [[Candida] arabinofermentans NRRL YB-2248]